MTASDSQPAPDNRVRGFGWALSRVGVPIAIGSAFVAFLLVYGFREGWGNAQWGPVAAWFSGILTAGAVSISLWQTLQARREAEASRQSAREQLEIAEKRHRDQLDKSDALLEKELASQRRAEQIRTIPPIWVAVSALTPLLLSFISTVESAFDRLERDSDPELRSLWARSVMSSGEELTSAMMTAELAFEPALTIIVEPHTQDVISTVYRDFRAFVEHLEQIASQARQGGRPSTTHLAPMLTNIRNQRRHVINTVREHLTEAPPLNISES